MSTVVVEREISQNALPVCLLRENPNRLVSLWDMLHFYADRFVKLISDLEEMERTLLSAPQKVHDPAEVQRVLELFQRALDHCKYLGLFSAWKQVERIIQRTSGPNTCTVAQFKDMITELRTRILEDCEAKVFFAITDRRIVDSFFKFSISIEEPRHLIAKQAAEVFDPAIVDRFPDTVDDMEEAIRSLVCMRHSGCVFHLMRIVEFGVRKVALVAGNTDPKPSWGSILQKIEKLVFRTEYRDLPSAIQPHVDFLKDMLPRLQAVQHAWRNKVLHVEDKLIPVSAEINEEVCWEILGATQGLMRKLASDLPVGF